MDWTQDIIPYVKARRGEGASLTDIRNELQTLIEHRLSAKEVFLICAAAEELI